MAIITVQRSAWVSVAIALAAATGFMGFVAGRSQQLRAMIDILQVNAAGNITQRVEVLSLLRMGDVPGAITRLESEVDHMTVSVALNRGADRNVLSYVKTYLSVAPPSPEREKRLSAALEGLPVLTLDKCPTALKALVRSKGGTGGPPK